MNVLLILAKSDVLNLKGDKRVEVTMDNHFDENNK